VSRLRPANHRAPLAIHAARGLLRGVAAGALTATSRIPMLRAAWKALQRDCWLTSFKTLTPSMWVFPEDVILFFLQFFRYFPQYGSRASDPQKPTIPDHNRLKVLGKCWVSYKSAPK